MTVAVVHDAPPWGLRYAVHKPRSVYSICGGGLSSQRSGRQAIYGGRKGFWRARADSSRAVGETYAPVSPFPEINAPTLETSLARLRTGNPFLETSPVFLGTMLSFLETKFLFLGISYLFLGTETPSLRTGRLFLGMRTAGAARKTCGENTSACSMPSLSAEFPARNSGVTRAALPLCRVP